MFANIKEITELIKSPVVPDPLDVRLRRRNLSHGIVTNKEVAEALKKLPDDTEAAEFVDYQSIVNGAHEPPAPHQPIARPGMQKSSVFDESDL